MRLLIAVIAILLAAALANAEPVTVNLARFHSHGLARIQQVYPVGSIRKDLGIWYSDISGSLDHLPAFDHSALELRVEVDPAVIPERGLIVVYQAGLNGEESLIYAKRERDGESYHAVNSGLATFKPGVRPQQIKTVIEKLQKAFPRARFNHFSQIGAVNFSAPQPAEFSALYAATKASELVASIDLD
ncbi:MAG TPA: hypothetical protein VFV50_11085, partial [Bdellovibrionales bacterium]|nr:hypothetical protein [Bdellovibrionales bacterium]